MTLGSIKLNLFAFFLYRRTFQDPCLKAPLWNGCPAEYLGWALPQLGFQQEKRVHLDNHIRANGNVRKETETKRPWRIKNIVPRGDPLS